MNTLLRSRELNFIEKKDLKSSIIKVFKMMEVLNKIEL